MLTIKQLLPNSSQLTKLVLTDRFLGSDLAWLAKSEAHVDAGPATAVSLLVAHEMTVGMLLWSF